MRKKFLIFILILGFAATMDSCVSKSRKYSSEGEETKESMTEEGVEAETGERYEENEENIE